MNVVVDVGARRESARTLTARDLCTPGWHIDPLEPSSAVAVIGGRAVPARTIATINVRQAIVRPDMLPWIDDGDRAYAAAEMTAVLTAWLAMLSGNVDRRPQPPAALGARDLPIGGRVLIVGSSVDTPASDVRRWLYRYDQSPIVLDETTLCYLDGAAILRDRRLGAIPLDLIGGAYLRPDTCLGPAQYALLAWAQDAPGIVVNRPAAMMLNASKPFQLREIARLGFDVPATLVTTDEQSVRDFRARHGRIVFKSASGIRSIASDLTEEEAKNLSRVAACPTMFQAWVPGVDVRVHVVGRDVFACEIEADQLDYRYGCELHMRPIDLDDNLRSRTVDMVSAMGLHVAGVDMRRRPDGGWTCLEVNPSPAFTWFTEYTGQPIAQAIARLLACS